MIVADDFKAYSHWYAATLLLVLTQNADEFEARTLARPIAAGGGSIAAPAEAATKDGLLAHINHEIEQTKDRAGRFAAMMAVSDSMHEAVEAALAPAPQGNA